MSGRRARADNDRRGGTGNPFDELSEELYHRKPALIKRAIALGARDADDAEGMIQEALGLIAKAILQGKCAFDAIEPFIAYFRKTLSSVAVDRHRSRARIDRADNATLEQQLARLGFESADDPEELLVAKEERWEHRQIVRSLGTEIQRLPNTQRRVIELRWFSDEERVVRYREIAEELGKSVPAVRSACRRGIATLRDLLSTDTLGSPS